MTYDHDPGLPTAEEWEAYRKAHPFPPDRLDLTKPENWVKHDALMKVQEQTIMESPQTAEQAMADLDAVIMSTTIESDEVFSRGIALELENRTKPSPDTAELAQQMRRLHKAYFREIKALTNKCRDLRGPPAPPPAGGFTDGMEWVPMDPQQRPPTPPPECEWSVEICGGDYEYVVYTLGRAELVTPNDRAEDARLIARWRNRLTAAQELPGHPSAGS
jgi:hypothetical protein